MSHCVKTSWNPCCHICGKYKGCFFIRVKTLVILHSFYHMTSTRELLLSAGRQAQWAPPSLLIEELTYSNQLNEGHREVVLVSHVRGLVLLVYAGDGEAEQRQQGDDAEAEVDLHQVGQLRPRFDLQEGADRESGLNKAKPIWCSWCQREGRICSPVHMV